MSTLRFALYSVHNDLRHGRLRRQSAGDGFRGHLREGVRGYAGAISLLSRVFQTPLAADHPSPISPLLPSP